MTAVEAAAVESLDQLTCGWRPLVLDADPAADVRDLPGVAVRWAESRFAFWNCVTLTEHGLGADRLPERLERAAEIMREKRRTGFLWLFEDLLAPAARAELPAAADRAGLDLAFSGAGMAGDLLPIPDPEHPLLEFVRVRTEEQLVAYADLNSRAYGFPPADGRDGLAGSRLWRTDVHAYLGLRDGVPVTAAATVPCEGRLFVVLVATDPAQERQGFGEAVTRKALHEGARATGLTRATLHATAAGAPVYRRIGLTPNTPIHYYSLRS
ncbi:GNAT family N-acetyltransferase [Saccharopolyspora gregorii]|uniref:N-acetyltransferase domain-containing protein n=1 Tax=Saccharopolyspora gregorii TaxID=33914 RepID=A0ABP6RUA7_9PSEU|nr:GNAT family N-acetyltransferase [Saccharopolyspora gregorii]